MVVVVVRVISHYHHYLSLAFLPSHRFLPLLSSLSPFSLSLSRTLALERGFARKE